ncbi:hypothetical protein D3C85_1020170 [compost metagenome]
MAQREAHAQGRQQQQRPFVTAPQVGKLQIGGQRGAAVEPDIAQLEMVGEQVQQQTQRGAVERAQRQPPKRLARRRQQHATQDQGCAQRQQGIARLRQEP